MKKTLKQNKKPDSVAKKEKKKKGKKKLFKKLYFWLIITGLELYTPSDTAVTALCLYWWADRLVSKTLVDSDFFLSVSAPTRPQTLTLHCREKKRTLIIAVHCLHWMSKKNVWLRLYTGVQV